MRQPTVIVDSDGDEADVPDIDVPALPLKAKRVLAEEVNEAAAKGGLIAVPSKAIRSCKVLGRYMIQEGAIEVAGGIYWLSAQNLGKAINRCGELIQRPPKPTGENESEAKIATDFFKALATMTETLNSTAKGILETAKQMREVEKPVEVPQQSPFQKGQTVVPIQTGEVHIHAGGGSK